MRAFDTFSRDLFMHFSITELPTCAGADKEYFMDREVAVVGRGRDDVVLCGARGRGETRYAT